MSGYCKPAKPAALFGDTNTASGIPNRSRILSRAKIPRPTPRLSRETLPDPAQPPIAETAAGQRCAAVSVPGTAKAPAAGGMADQQRAAIAVPDPTRTPAKSQTRLPGIGNRGDASSAQQLGNPLAIQVPEVHLTPSTGPVYLEGRLVLSLSFRLEKPTGNRVPVPEGERLLERYRIWDDTAHNWLAGGPCMLRFESADVVMSTQPRPAIAWAGALDVRRPIIGVPDFDEAGDAINEAHCLRWRKCTG